MVANASFIVAFSSRKAGDDLHAPTLLLEAALGEVSGADPDAMTHRHPMDRKQGLPVVFEAGDGCREPSPVGGREAVRGRSRGIEGGGLPDRPDVGHDLSGLVIGGGAPRNLIHPECESATLVKTE